MVNANELAAAEALLDRGVSVPVVSWHWPFREKLHELRVTVRRPYLGTQIRLARRWLKTGLNYDDVASLDKDGQLSLLRDHGREVARMAAGVIWRGKLCDRLLGWLTARFLLRFSDMRYILAIITRFALLGDTTSFENTIAVVQRTNPMTPRTSQRKGS